MQPWQNQITGQHTYGWAPHPESSPLLLPASSLPLRPRAVLAERALEGLKLRNRDLDATVDRETRPLFDTIRHLEAQLHHAERGRTDRMTT